jgi:hypothetical protein
MNDLAGVVFKPGMGDAEEGFEFFSIDKKFFVIKKTPILHCVDFC